ncbi:hypothetical protein J2Z62_000366 [Mycoplasmoides fastidiosum]|uniref:Lipoprotein n=1 Tax=Mycoplasmoides fastidiosum TaxID=92758 RepID=A0ABU0LZA1_9BACT|nr:hypothetical protein [Mycoplasmoides fastidiosum]MDQ0513928.1 hypothetical protein [Mycoplasmoides fastidiosum]UUD37658.1 hypothetical protein NPA10_03765 [Mycoplasmoides fastidiosum]
MTFKQSKKSKTVSTLLFATIPLPIIIAACTTVKTVGQVAMKFKAQDKIDLADLLSAATGGSFANGMTSYQNDGNENLTTRAGLNVTKAAAITAIKANLGIGVDNKLLSNNEFGIKFNKLLEENQQLSEIDLQNIDSVLISMPSSADKTTLNDYLPSSWVSPIVTEEITFILKAKQDQQFSHSSATELKISGPVKIKLTDYRRIDETSLVKQDNQTIQVLGSKPMTNPKNSDLLTALNETFSIEDAKFATPLFPIWNIKKDGTPKWFQGSTNNPVKHSLTDEQIEQLIQLWKDAKPDAAVNSKGDFPAVRVKRAVEKVNFSLADGVNAETTVTPSSDKYSVKVNLSLDLMQHWSWNYQMAYSDAIRSYTFKDITLMISYNQDT